MHNEISSFGWVKSAHVSEAIGLGGSGLGGSAGGMAGTSDWGGCGSEAPHYVEMGTVREQVGVVLQGTRVRILGETDMKRSEIELLGPSVREVPSRLTLMKGARLLMRNEDAARCQWRAPN